MDFEKFESTQEFADLAETYMDIIKDGDFTVKALQTTQIINLHKKVEALLDKINSDAVSNGNQLLTNGNGVNLFTLLVSSITILFRQNQTSIISEYVDKIKELEEENKELKAEKDSSISLHSNSEIEETYKEKIIQLEETIKNESSSIITRISNQLSLNLQDIDESHLISAIEKKIKKQKKLSSSPIQEFNFPIETRPTQQKTDFEYQETISRQNEILSAKSEELQNLSTKNLHLENKVEELQQQIERKDTEIEKLKEQNDNIQIEVELKEKMNQTVTHQNISEDDAQIAFIEEMKVKNRSLKKKNNELERKTQRYKTKLDKLNNKILRVQGENESIKEENLALQQKLNEIQEIANFEYENKETTTNEREKFDNALEELSQQLEKQRKEIEKETTIRTEFEKHILTLLKLNQELETKLEESQFKIKTNQSQYEIAIKQLKDIIQSKKHDLGDTDLFDSILQISNNFTSELRNSIYEIINNDNFTTADKILNVFQTVSSSVTTVTDTDEIQKVKDLNEKLIEALYGQLHFMENIIGSSDIQTWLFPQNSTEEINSNLITQCSRIENFITENANGLINHPNDSIFEQLLPKEDPLQMSTNLYEYIRKYQNPTTEESKELFVLFLQTLTACDILRKFAVEAQRQCTYQTTQIKTLKNDIHSIKEEAEEQFYNKYNEAITNMNIMQGKYEDMEKVLKNVKTILRNSIKSGENLTTILRSIEQINQIEELNADEYISELESKFLLIQEEYQKQKEDESKIVRINNKIKELKKKTQKEMMKKDKEIQQIKDEMNEKDEIIRCKDEEINKIQMEKEEINQKIEIIYKEKEIEQNEIQREFNKTKNEFIRNTTKLERIVENLEIKVKKVEKSERNIRMELKEKNAEIKKLIEMNNFEKNELKQKHQNQIDEITKSKEKIIIEKDDLKRKIEILNNEISDLNIELKTTNSKLRNCEDELNKKKSLFESQMRLRKFTIEREAQKVIDDFKAEYNNQMHEFLSMICHTFKEMVDITQTINFKSVESLILRVKEKILTLNNVVTAGEQVQKEMIRVKQILNINNETIKPSQAVLEKMKQISSQEKEIKRLEEECKDLKKDSIRLSNQETNTLWEEWARRLYSFISLGLYTVKTTKEIRDAIEETVYSTTVGNRRLIRNLNALKQEKILLLKGANKVKANEKEQPGIFSLMCVVTAVRRMQKISGHMQTKFKFEADKLNEKTKDIKRKNIPTKAFVFTSNNQTPLLSNFVVKSTKVNENKISNVF
ncbi:viral A-type inclusion protein [Histomonas meleagridis]|uniref:viral A-type inclusion protein n=1 Tax=Histomonas meleagridis TaxID=135588 RepID=UPI00355974C0|nr:viral A-type inclusion protein [Histomonas meleagridis]KAH0805538.1 viral A-type inclusion protein [Histomonas meleagridis]